MDPVAATTSIERAHLVGGTVVTATGTTVIATALLLPLLRIIHLAATPRSAMLPSAQSDAIASAEYDYCIGSATTSTCGIAAPMTSTVIITTTSTTCTAKTTTTTSSSTTTTATANYCH